MSDYASRPELHANGARLMARQPLSLSALRQRLGVLRGLLPAGMLLLVILYELGPALWIHNRFGDRYHFVAEIAFYGTVGPLLAFFLLRFMEHWLEERETSELQARVLAQAREQARVTHDLTDNVLQSLFGLSILLGSLKSNLPDLSPAETAQFEEAERAVNSTIQQLYDNTTHMRRGPS